MIFWELNIEMNINDMFSYHIPDWVRWLAQDSSGIWWGYSIEPLRMDKGWYENEVGRYVRLGFTDPEDWENSLTKIE
jgi:hypothetical protein